MIYKESALHKFNAQQVHFTNSYVFNSIDELKQSNVEDDSFCLVFGELCEELHLEDFFLVECISYFCEAYKLVVIKRVGCETRVRFPSKIMGPVERVSLSLICTEDPLYVDFLMKAIAWYRNIFSGIVPLEICLAYYGNNPPTNVDKVSIYDYSDFSMASGRNRSQLLCSNDFILAMDLDCYLSKNDIEFLINRINNNKTHGLIHIRPNNYKVSSGGRYFGLKNVLQQNLYDERFKFCWSEDTEYLMNFSRCGIVPNAEFIDFIREEHPRTKTMSSPYKKHNHDLYYNILKNGR